MNSMVDLDIDAAEESNKKLLTSKFLKEWNQGLLYGEETVMK